MPATIRSQSTIRFVDPWPYIACGATGLVILALMSSLFFQKSLRFANIKVSEAEPVKLKPVLVSREPIGALRIDTKVMLPDNHWVTYEIQLFDQQNHLLASGIKQAWSESGTWTEEGESGTWHEDDLWAGLDVRTTKDKEMITIAVEVLEYSDTSGQEIDQPVPFQVTIRSGVVDARYLWAGLFGAASFAALACKAVGTKGNTVIAKTLKNCNVSDRAITGGRNCLVQVTVQVNAGGTAPRQLQGHLCLKDAQGEQVYSWSFLVMLKSQKDDAGHVKRATGRVEARFILEPRTSYGFQIAMLPARHIEQTQLIVREGTHTLQAVEIVHIHSA